MKNKYGICEWYLAIPGPAAIKTADKLGFDGIQISDLQGIKGNYPLNDPRIQDLYLEAVEDSGIELQAFLPGASLMAYGSICHPLDSAQGEEALHSFKKSLDVCKALDIPRLVVPGLESNRVNNEYQYKNTCSMLKRFIEEAEEYGVTVTYESFLPTDKLLALIEFTDNKLKTTFDTLNPIRYGFSDPSEEIKRIGIETIDHVHVKDAYKNLVGTCPLGSGAGRFDETISTLKKSGYAGWYITEGFYYLPPMSDLGEGWDLAKADLKYMKKACE